jgi:hypothetical protein
MKRKRKPYKTHTKEFKEEAVRTSGRRWVFDATNYKEEGIDRKQGRWI